MARIIIYTLALIGIFALIGVYGCTVEILNGCEPIVDIALYMILAIIAMMILIFLDLREE